MFGPIRTPIPSITPLAMAAGVFVAAPVLAQVEFTPRDIFIGADGANSVFAADVDGDGDTDVVSASASDAAIRWYENDGAQVPAFTPHDIFIGATLAVSVFAADLDGDGDTDILSSTIGDDVIRWHENDGADDPSFTTRVLFAGTADGGEVFAVDVDGDGDMDVLSASSGDDTIRWHENDGADDPSFTPRTIFIGADGAKSVFPADVDGDGDTDVLSASSDDDTIRWYENDGATDPTFTARVIFTGADGAVSVFAADVDGDGDTDVLSASFLDYTIRWYENDGSTDPTFTPRDIFTSAISTESVFAADVDRDGDIDVLSASGDDRTVRWYENSGARDPTFRARDIFTGAEGVASVFAADVDGDGDTDVLSASRRDEAIRWYQNGLRAVVNTTAATSHDTIAEAIVFATPGDELVAFADRFAAEPIIDFDGTGLSLRSEGPITQDASGVYTLADDAALAAAPGTDMDLSGRTTAPVGAFAVLRGDRFTLRSGATLGMGLASGVFVDAPLGATVEAGLSLASNSTLGFSGDLDLAAPTDQFTEPRSIFSGAAGAGSVFAADVDGDGDTDVLSASSGDNAIRWYENDGAENAAFTPRDIFLDATGAESVYAADMDGDGDTDVLSASFLDNTIRWYENDGGVDPAFAPRDIFNGAAGAQAVLAIDLDGDGDTDVLSTSTGDNTIRWYENDGGVDPAFTPHDIFTGAGTLSIFAVDLDGDGDTDVLSTSNGDDTIRWYESDGATDPTFTPRVISAGAGIISVFAADVDGDGDTDVLSASLNDNTIRWYENDGAADPAFTPREIFANALGAASVFATDIDGDGDTDVLSASFFDNTVRWYENDGASDPGFAPRDIFTGAVNARSVFAADVSGDGLADVLSASFGDNAIRWYEQQLIPTHSIPTGAILASGSAITSAARLGLFSGTITAESGLTNRGTITGFGNIDASVVNERAVMLQGATNVRGAYTNNGATTIQNGTLTILGALTNNGSIIGDFAGLDPRGDRQGGLFIESDLAFGASATLRMASENARLSAGGDVDIAINGNTRYDMSQAELRMVALGGAQSLEVMSADIGNDVAGLDRMLAGHYPIGTLRVGPTATTANLIDDHDNANDGQDNCEAIYTRNLVIDAGATLNTNGCRIYYETLTLNGAVDNPDNLIQLGGNCLTDWDGNGVVNAVDVGAFLTDYFEDLANGTLLTDFDGNGVVNAADVGAFLSQYFEDLVNPDCNGG